MIRQLVVTLEKTMAELQDLLANCPQEAKELITTSFWEKIEAALQVGLLYAPLGRQTYLRRQAKALRREAAKHDENLEGNFGMQVKTQLKNLREVKEQVKRFQTVIAEEWESA